MSRQKKHRKSVDFLRYLKGEMTREERYSFERDMETDLFEKEAMEGLQQIDPARAEEDLLRLHSRIGNRVKRKRRITYYSIAATVASLLVVGTIFLRLYDFKPETGEGLDEQPVLRESEGLAAETEPLRESEKEAERKAGRAPEDAKTATPAGEAPATEDPRAETPRAEDLRAEDPRAETPRAEDPRAETPRAEDLRAEDQGRIRKKTATDGPAQAEPAPAELAQAEPLQAEPAQAEPAPAETAPAETAPAESGGDKSTRETALEKSASDDAPITHVEAELPGIQQEQELMQEHEIIADEMKVTIQKDELAEESVLPDRVTYQERMAAPATAAEVQGNLEVLETAGVVKSGVVMKMDAFPAGGMLSYEKYLRNAIRLPEELASGDSVNVLLQFIIDSSGQLKQFQPIETPGESFTREAVRLVRQGPSWSPAMGEGKHIPDTVRLNIPFVK